MGTLSIFLDSGSYKILKLRRGILHYLWAADLLERFSQLITSIFILSQYFLIDFARWKI